MIQKRIPFSEILQYLTNIEKRAFQSLNHQSRRLLLANVDKIIIHDRSLSFEKINIYLDWLRDYGRYMVGITKIIISVQQEELLTRIMTILSALEYKNVKSIKMEGYSRPLANPAPFRAFFSKVSTVFELSITYNILISIHDLSTFRFIRHFEISLFLEGQKIFFSQFFHQNSWRHLSVLKLHECDTDMFATLCEVCIRDASPLQTVILFTCDFTPPPGRFLPLKKLRTVHLFDIRFPDLLIERFLTPSLTDLACDSVSPRILSHIARHCLALEKLSMYDTHFTARDFQHFFEKNNLGNLKELSYEAYLVHNQDNIRFFFPKLETLKIIPLQILNAPESTRFFTSVVELENIEFSSSLPILDICRYVRNVPRLKSFIMLDPVLSRSDVVLLMNTLPLHQMRVLQFSVSENVFQTIVPFLLHTRDLQKLQILYLFPHITRQEAEESILYVLDIIERLNIQCKHLTDLSLIINIDNVNTHVPHQHQRFLRLKHHFPKLKSVQLGWGYFYYDYSF